EEAEERAEALVPHGHRDGRLGERGELGAGRRLRHAAVARAVGADDEDVGVERGAPVLVRAVERQARGAPVPLEPPRPVDVLWVVQPMCPELAVAGAVGSDDADRVAVGGYVGDRVVQRLRIATGTFGPLRTVGALR